MAPTFQSQMVCAPDQDVEQSAGFLCLLRSIIYKICCLVVFSIP